MIIKFIDAYFETKLTEEAIKRLLDKCLEEHIRENLDFDFEHFIEVLEESGKFEIIDVDKSFDLEYTQDEIDALVEKINENICEESFDEDEDYEEFDDDDDDEENG